MQNRSFYLRNMLLGYDKQLVTARRLSRLRRARGLEEDRVEFSPRIKRMQLVERVAKEIMDNLVTAGSNNPIVTEIKDRLNREMGARITLALPPAVQDLQVFRDGADGPEEVSLEEQNAVLGRLWEITLKTVDETML